MGLSANAHAAGGSWTLVTQNTPFPLSTNSGVINVYGTTFTSPTLTSDKLSFSSKSCLSVDLKGTDVSDTFAIVGSPLLAETVTTTISTASATTAGTHASIAGAVRSLRVQNTLNTAAAGTYTVYITEVQNCQR